MFQQDDTAVHLGVAVHRFLHDVFANRWIGRRTVVECPPRSSDLTPLDLFFGKIYIDRPHTLVELQARIQPEIRLFPIYVVERGVRNI